ncbi:hypothetical protein BR10RB9215_C11394 [Brucella sp. 10RB9215]|uniref:Uncharacterized protein n=1 Tax=Brucella ceti str. Cudo TaxID=595497 RepID=C0G8D6_9HYPH|nr:hypothetical protein DK48_420 [Brucella abortus]AIJ63876.1 hypothetical protein DO74_189 [Brucella abortus bv. 6 str. 870]AIJ68983.1 hypothetical protein DM38_931 [Brucella suis]AIJ70313.1 hypothetical protein DK67_597 [Brucella suis bv. 3 str. 686]AIJ74985.1 hypothetical protein DK65_1766 [Brucella pinnipedialis]AIJ95367.1 hypothetical protein DK61_1795 [Brucella melitensis bv. 2 str. 63/9]EEH13200.1 Hypothetical protein BCETI_6000105 [Brucella ceti str. Cudo]EFM56670.1 Hypothetical prot
MMISLTTFLHPAMGIFAAFIGRADVHIKIKKYERSF